MKILIANPGLDGHDRGAKVICRALRDEGYDVLYLGIRVTPQKIVDTAVREKVNVVGLSCLAGNHMRLFDVVFPWFWQMMMYEVNFNLFDFIRNSLVEVKDYLGIDTPLITSSTLPVDRALKGKHKVLEICAQLGADEYINPIGGVELYNKVEFNQNGVELKFLKANDNITYKQFDNEFVPWLSILDVMMFNTVEQIQKFLKQYILQ